MKRICLISHGQPSRNPRLIRDANCLSIAGYDVTVLTPRILKLWVKYDDEIVNNAKWKYVYLDYVDQPLDRLYWQYVRVRKRISQVIAPYFTSEYVVANSVEYLNQELFIKASKIKADIYIAHQQQALPAAAWAATKNNGKFAVDIHDLLADCSSEPVYLIKYIENRYLQECAYVSTMSTAAAQRIKEINHLSTTPIVRYNTQRIEDRQSILHPSQRQCAETLSIYWFGQTIGSHSRADQVLKAIPLLAKSVKLVLRGNTNTEFTNYLISLAKELNISHCLEIKPIASPIDMVSLAANHDILLGSQPGKELFHQMAIGNKVFTGMMAGLALALTDTIAHRQFLQENPGCGFLFPDQDEVALAELLNNILMDKKILEDMKVYSWNLAERFFNCEKECDLFVNTISSLI
jgi:glycosyltransferase involved in cell wall biosynthesis